MQYLWRKYSRLPAWLCSSSYPWAVPQSDYVKIQISAAGNVKICFLWQFMHENVAYFGYECFVSGLTYSRGSGTCFSVGAVLARAGCQLLNQSSLGEV